MALASLHRGHTASGASDLVGGDPGAALVSGRLLTPADTRTEARVGVVEQDLARATYRGVTTAITGLGLLIVGMSMVALITTITMVVLERTREIGILRCIGAQWREELQRLPCQHHVESVVLVGHVAGLVDVVER